MTWITSLMAIEEGSTTGTSPILDFMHSSLSNSIMSSLRIYIVITDDFLAERALDYSSSELGTYAQKMGLSPPE
jgi:hypothetical protein